MARKSIPLRIDPAVHEAIDLETDAQIRDALRRAGRLPRNVGELPRRGRPPKGDATED